MQQNYRRQLYYQNQEYERSDATAYVRDKEEVRQEEEIRQIDQRSPFHRVGEINGAISKLWTALTGLKNMPHYVDDVTVAYIKPTRGFRTDIANGTPKTDGTQIHNWIVWTQMALDDMDEALKH